MVNPAACGEALGRIGIAVEQEAELLPHVTLRIAGRASLLVHVSTREQLIAALQHLIAAGVPYVVLGGGSNVVFTSEHTRAAVVLDRTAAVECRGDILRVSSGLPLSTLLARCAAHGWSGLEFMAGIPGSVGGSLAVNAGAFGRSLSECVRELEIIGADGRVQRVAPDYCAFRYRESILKYGRDTILQAWFSVHADDPAAITARIREHIAYRTANHPSYRLHSAGCFFKNPRLPEAPSAGKLIEQSGCKGLRRGHLEVAEKHANFILNHGQTTFPELQGLVQEIVDRVETASGLRLEREVIYIDGDGGKS